MPRTRGRRGRGNPQREHQHRRRRRAGPSCRRQVREEHKMIEKANLPAEYQTYLEEAERILKAANTGPAPILKFNKGHYYIGETEVPLGRQFVAYCGDWRRGWRLWLDGQVVDDRVVRVADDPNEPPERDELDPAHDDETTWPVVDGEARDPWVFENQLPVEDIETG